MITSMFSQWKIKMAKYEVKIKWGTKIFNE
jgi:hypothetical protein